MTTPAQNDDLNPDAPCAQCGAPTIRGLNTDFCSEGCERAFGAEHPEDAEDDLGEER